MRCRYFCLLHILSSAWPQGVLLIPSLIEFLPITVLECISSCCFHQGCFHSKQWCDKCPYTYTVDSVFAELWTLYLLIQKNLFVTPKAILMVLWESFMGMCMWRVVKNLSPNVHTASWGGTSQCCAFLSQLSYCKQVSFHSIFSATFLVFVCFLWYGFTI